MGEKTDIEQRIMEANRRWPLLEFKRKNNNEASASCPICRRATTDGFLIFGNGGYFCRKCNAKGWLDEENPKPLDPIEQLALKVAALEKQQLDQERRLTALEEMHKCTDHLKYHTHTDYEYWIAEGIFPETADQFLLGYCQSCPTFRQSASHTIPVLDYNKRLANIRHRLISPNGKGKYRPHRAGLGPQLFNSSILQHPLSRVLLIEGEKKAVVTTQYGWPSVGVMGKNTNERKLSTEWLPWFNSVKELIICLDPDAIESAWRLGEIFARGGHRGVRVASFPSKPDDMLTLWKANEDDIEGYLTLARPVWGKR